MIVVGGTYCLLPSPAAPAQHRAPDAPIPSVTPGVFGNAIYGVPHESDDISHDHHGCKRARTRDQRDWKVQQTERRCPDQYREHQVDQHLIDAVSANRHAAGDHNGEQTGTKTEREA